MVMPRPIGPQALVPNALARHVARSSSAISAHALQDGRAALHAAALPIPRRPSVRERLNKASSMTVSRRSSQGVLRYVTSTCSEASTIYPITTSSSRAERSSRSSAAAAHDSRSVSGRWAMKRCATPTASVALRHWHCRTPRPAVASKLAGARAGPPVRSSLAA